MGPARLPEPVVDKLKKALAEALQAPELRKKLESSGSGRPSPSVDIDKFLKAETAKYQQDR
jgi:tripartite-type tricarboxylate transporter receptor subunit TctC